ncbi:E3 ubiquitin-protein ligase rnf8-A-like [Ctenocephalides felis]|uniref:E3 ubiquitin-protein ligase rnf8-A-like n=1 Tax=Ctenocephalides felis TaxID=7515 RepID=UPI000E6E252E|nr:E3 ubiquitin-protein ligase rnf8-A-like [Ctenocephalides felis]
MASKSSSPKRPRINQEADEQPYLLTGNQKFTLENCEFTIGRDLSNNHVIPDVVVSRYHCIIEHDKPKDQWTVKDISTGGTYVNDVLLKKNTPQLLQNGDKVRIPENYIYEFFKPKTSKKKAEKKKRSAASLDETVVEKENNSSPRSKKFHQDCEEETTCAICNEMFVKTIALNCSHAFCKSCIVRWKQTKKICPICRTKITAEVPLLLVDNIINSFYANGSDENKRTREQLIKDRIEIEKSLEPKKKPSRSGSTNRRRRTRVYARTAPRTTTSTTSYVSSNSIIVVDDDSDTSIISSDDELNSELNAIYAAMELRFPASFMH